MPSWRMLSYLSKRPTLSFLLLLLQNVMSVQSAPSDRSGGCHYGFIRELAEYEGDAKTSQKHVLIRVYEI
jgi:hypothetical protein